MTAPVITSAEVKTLLESNGCFLIDIRDPEEVAEGKIPQAIAIPMEHLEEKLRGMKKDAPIVLVCAHGKRSRAAAEGLAQAGYTNVRSMRGGLEEWGTDA